MDERCLIGKRNFSRVVREIARDVATGGAEHRFESDALMALQMATEHIMIMIFELTYDIHHSGIIDYRNKLAIHAKRVTIQAKDMSLLRELWHSIDPVFPIGERRSRGGLSLVLQGLRQQGKQGVCPGLGTNQTLPSGTSAR